MAETREIVIFTERCCPFCYSASRENLFILSAEDFCELNWTYSPQYRSILNLDGQEYFPVSRCLSCGFVYASLLPSEEFLTLVYDEVIDFYLAEKASLEFDDYARRLRYIGTLIQISSELTPRFLDFGAGYGVSSRLLDLVGLDVIAYDTSSSRKKYLGGSNLRICKDWSEIRVAGPYSVVILDNVLEHIADVRGVLQQISEIVEENAKMYVSVPSYEQSIIKKLQKNYTVGSLSDMSLNPWEHLNYFDLEHLDSLLADYGFTPLKRNELPAPVDIGLRSEADLHARCKNGLASMKRLLAYIIHGTVNESVNDRFYQFKGALK